MPNAPLPRGPQARFARGPPSPASLVLETVPRLDASGSWGCGVAGEVGGGLSPPGHLELGQDARDVVLDRLLGEAEFFADLLVGLAVGHQLQDPLLLGREAGQLLVLHQVLALAEAVQDALGDGRVQQALALAHGPNGPDQFAPLDLLQDIAGGSGHDRGEEGVVVGERGQNQDLDLWAAGLDLSSGLDPAPVGEAHVHDYDVGTSALGLFDRVTHGAGLAGHNDVLAGFEHGRDAASDYLVVVNEQDSQG